MSADADERRSADLQGRLRGVRERIARAAETVGRDPASIRLVAVTKAHPVGVARAAVALGLEDLGENRVDELVAKHAHLDARACDGTRHRELSSGRAADVVIFEPGDRCVEVGELEGHDAGLAFEGALPQGGEVSIEVDTDRESGRGLEELSPEGAELKGFELEFLIGIACLECGGEWTFPVHVQVSELGRCAEAGLSMGAIEARRDVDLAFEGGHDGFEIESAAQVFNE
jgi:hypothetical protein